jgi:hypothetical protein
LKTPPACRRYLQSQWPSRPSALLKIPAESVTIIEDTIRLLRYLQSQWPSWPSALLLFPFFSFCLAYLHTHRLTYRQRPWAVTVTDGVTIPPFFCLPAHASSHVQTSSLGCHSDRWSELQGQLFPAAMQRLRG